MALDFAKSQIESLILGSFLNALLITCKGFVTNLINSVCSLIYANYFLIKVFD